MFDLQRQVRLKQAELALREGRIDEAFAIATEKEIRDHRGGQVLLENLVQPLLDRAERHMGGERLQDALLDVERAIQAGGNRPRAAELRKQIRDALASKDRAARRVREIIDSAQAHFQNGHLRTGLAALGDAPSGLPEADRLRRGIESRERRAEEARKRAQALLNGGDLLEALTALADAAQAGPREEELLNLQTAAKKEAIQAASRALETGDLLVAGEIVVRLVKAAGESLESRRILDVLALAKKASRSFQTGDAEAARAAVTRLRKELPEAPWVEESLRELSRIAEATAILRAGPLGADAPNALPGPAPPPLGSPAAAFQSLAAELSTPSRLLLWVDGVGTYLLLFGDRVTFGRAGSSARPDIALAADISGLHAEILRTEDDYFVVAAQGGVEVGGQRVTRRLLSNGDTIALAPAARLTFELPTPLSPSAVLTLKNQRIEGDVRKVILFKDHMLLGAEDTCHVQAAPATAGQKQVILSAAASGILCRAQTPIQIDGAAAGLEAVVPLGAHVQIGNLTFTITRAAQARLG